MPTLPVLMLVAGGMFILFVLTFQMLVGYRKIKLKGPRHLKVHRAAAWVLVAAALVHGTAALVYLGLLS